MEALPSLFDTVEYREGESGASHTVEQTHLLMPSYSNETQFLLTRALGGGSRRSHATTGKRELRVLVRVLTNAPNPRHDWEKGTKGTKSPKTFLIYPKDFFGFFGKV